MGISKKFDVFDAEEVVLEGNESGNLVNLKSDSGYVPEWLLIELLCRLPAKCVFRYKSVSKEWLSLISDPSFVRFYLSQIKEHPWTILSGNLHVDGSEKSSNFPKDILLSDEEKFLSAIPFPGSQADAEGKKYDVVAVSDGFVLYAERVYMECGITVLNNYTIFSPTTGQCFALPQPSSRLLLNTTGFITRVEGGTLRSFRVVRLGLSLDRCKALVFEVFSSETGAWEEAIVHSDQEIEVAWRRRPESFNGNLHWVDRRLGILAYDPYNNPNCIRIIPLPDEIDQDCNNSIYNGIPSLCLEHKGCLWYHEVLVPSDGDDLMFSGFRTWVLEDYYDSNSWSLYEEVRIKDLSFGEKLNVEKVVGFIPVPIGFHPFKPNMVFLGWGDILVSYDIKARKLEGVIENPTGDDLNRKGEACWWQTSLFVLPKWPTPITIHSLIRSEE